MGVFERVSYREWSQLDSVASWETAGEDVKESCNNTLNPQVVAAFHRYILGDVSIHAQREYGVDSTSICFLL